MNSREDFFPLFHKYEYENESQRESTVEVEPGDVGSGDEGGGGSESVGLVGEGHDEAEEWAGFVDEVHRRAEWVGHWKWRRWQPLE